MAHTRFAFTTMVALLLLSLFTGPSHALYAMITTSQFQEWYSEYGRTFEYIRDHNCSKEYAIYLTGNKTLAPTDWLSGGAETNRLTQPLVNCILGSTSEFIKGNMGSAAVMLGLTPTILSMLGPTVDEVATLSIIGRKPLLAFLVAGSSPVVNGWAMINPGSTNRSLRKGAAVNMLHDSPWRYRMADMNLGSTATLFAEYSLLLGAIAMLGWTCAELAFRTICNFAPETNVLPLIWTWVSLVIHLPGAYAMHLRLCVVSGEGNAISWSLRSWLKYQFIPYKNRPSFEVRQNQENFRYIVACWFTSFLVVLHLILGTLVWSSLLFISVRDSLTVIARYILCQLVSKAVLMIELATLRDALSPGIQRVDEHGEVIYELERRITASSDGYKPSATLLEYARTRSYS